MKVNRDQRDAVTSGRRHTRGRWLGCLVAVLTSVVMTLSLSVDAATLCDQTFTVYGKTAGDHSILLWDVEVGGECQSATSYALFLGNYRVYVMTAPGSIHDYAPEFLADAPTEKAITVGDSSGIFRLTDSLHFTVPPTDTTFVRKLRGLVANGGSGDANEWRRNCPVNCSDYPVFYGGTATLVYQYPGGIYKNYGITQAVYFPESLILVLVTDQPEKAVGLDTMHGLLVYKLTPQTGVEK